MKYVIVVAQGRDLDVTGRSVGLNRHDRKSKHCQAMDKVVDMIHSLSTRAYFRVIGIIINC